MEVILSDLKIDDERIAVILPRSVDRKNYLNPDALSHDAAAVIGQEIGVGKIALVYVDEIKGVEFDRVFVIPNSMSPNERYIAFTRALSNLTLVFDDAIDSQEAIDLDDKKRRSETRKNTRRKENRKENK